MSELNIDELKSKISAAKSVLVLLPPTPENDLVRAGLTLHTALKQSGKTSLLGCSSPVAGQDEIKTTVGKQNLIISFPYEEDAVEHVSYDIDESGNKFNLIIRPKEGKNPLDINKVEYNFTGAAADLVFTLGINSLEELGKLYADEKSFLDNAAVVNVKKGGQPADFAAMDLSSVRVSSWAELLSWLLRTTGLKLTPELAGSLYRQLLTGTNNFQSPLITAETFEAAAYLLRQGARTAPVFAPQPQPQAPVNLPPAPFFPAPQINKPKPQLPVQPQPAAPQPVRNQNVPQDWQKPKIFRAGEVR